MLTWSIPRETQSIGNGLKSLTIKEIRLAALPHVIPQDSTLKREVLLEYLNTCALEVQNRVVATANDSAAAKASRKRKQRSEQNERYRAKRSKPGTTPTLEPDLEHFLDLPTPEQQKDLRRAFIAATSNEALAQAVCASCSRLLFRKALTQVNYLELKNSHIFEPTTPHNAHVLSSGLLLDHEHLDISENKLIGWICHHCSAAHNLGKRPAYSLANNMWTGDLTPVLSELTLPERLLIALRFPRAYVFKLFLKSGRGTDHPLAIQTQLKGNVTTYHANVDAVKEMLQGQFMPRRTSILPSLIAVTFVGKAMLSKSRLKSLFRVRRKVVLEALMVLKTVTKHPGCLDLDIDEDTLHSLPEDEVPEEILAAVRQDDDAGVIARESAGYIPAESEAGDNDRGGAHAGDTMTSDSTTSLSDNYVEDLDIIPLEYSGIAAADSTQITPQELLHNAVKKLTPHLQQEMTNEGGYIVQHGGFARDFGPALSRTTDQDTEEPNPSTYAFPHLFPYGVGGLEAKRDVLVSFVEHIRCLLQRRDFRFRKDSVFPFWALSLEQKRQALHAAQLTMSRKDFDRVCTAVGQLNAEDYKQAALDEAQGIPTQDPKIALVKKMVRVTMQKVMGSDASRALNRSKIWSTSLYLNPVNLWLTLNFIDRHDPICQVFAGKKIDMNDISRVLNLSAQDRAINVAQDPFAATQFFFFLAKTVFTTLFEFSTDSRLADNKMGELGKGSAYFGAVKAQGRGSLHLHLMMWLANSPNADEITHKLQSPGFREKIKAYMQQNIRAHLDGLTEETLELMEPESALAWGRPPDPDSPSYDEDMRTLELRLAHAQQYHKCSFNTCKQYDKRKHKMVCKRKAPFQLSPEHIVTDSGEIHPKRLIAWLNNWCPAVFYGGRCNNDIKFITNGAIARALAWYVTFYATKKQGVSFNISAIIEKTFAYHAEKTPKTDDAREKNCQFIFRCGMSLNREMEFSGQQAMAYLMGHGDTISSHTYVTIWWSTVVSALKTAYPELKSSTTGHANSISEEDKSDVARVDFRNDGTVYLRSQLDDYRYRADKFESLFFLDYLVNTYEERVKRNNTPDTDNIDSGDPSAPRRGRPQNARARYKPGHPRAETHQRVLRSSGHRTLPDIVGPWFARRDDPDIYPLYCASVLAALRPWRDLSDLKEGFDSWADALHNFLLVATPRQKSIQANMQYYYQCQQSAEQTRDEESSGEPDDEPEDEMDLHEYVNGIELEKVVLSRAKQKEIEHAARAAEIGIKLGMFGSSNIAGDVPWAITQTATTTGSQDEVMEWTRAMRQAAMEHQSQLARSEVEVDMGSIEAMTLDLQDLPDNVPSVTYEGDTPLAPEVDVSMLSSEQSRAFEIVKNHFLGVQNGHNPEQLLMQIQGAGGTGKSAYTGIAASLIEGSTLHQLALLHLCNKLSKKTITRLREIWGPVQYLIIDEISMVSKKVLAEISQMIGIGKQKEDEINSTLAFGGVNVIIAGDFHQFPPVIGGRGNGALYVPVGATATPKMILGRSIYEQFRTVVILKKQFRVDDERWSGILTRARQGKCSREDIKTIRGLILEPNRDKNLFTKPGWADAVLVTPRHSVRHRWNELASYNHCRSTGQQLFLSQAYDTHKNKPLDGKLKALLQAQLFSGKATDGTPVKGDAGGLSDVVCIAVGMKVMVTYNIETELDVANGARGTVVRIITDPSDAVGNGTRHVQELSRPPICVLVKLWRTKITKLGDLDEGVVPIVPIRSQFKLYLSNQRELTISREQLPLTPAYAFTDYRSQGQTIPYIIMDLATPPTGGLTPFNGYVTLSRSRKSSTARLLRDFDEKLFTTAPDEYLELEDRRLDELDAITARQLDNPTSEAASGE